MRRNIQLCARACNSDDTDEWTDGRKSVLYADPNVSYAGKLVGGDSHPCAEGRGGQACAGPRWHTDPILTTSIPF